MTRITNSIHVFKACLYFCLNMDTNQFVTVNIYEVEFTSKRCKKNEMVLFEYVNKWLQITKTWVHVYENKLQHNVVCSSIFILTSVGTQSAIGPDAKAAEEEEEMETERTRAVVYQGSNVWPTAKLCPRPASAWVASRSSLLSLLHLSSTSDSSCSITCISPMVSSYTVYMCSVISSHTSFTWRRRRAPISMNSQPSHWRTTQIWGKEEKKKAATLSAIVCWKLCIIFWSLVRLSVILSSSSSAILQMPSTPELQSRKGHGWWDEHVCGWTGE